MSTAYSGTEVGQNDDDRTTHVRNIVTQSTNVSGRGHDKQRSEMSPSDRRPCSAKFAMPHKMPAKSSRIERVILMLSVALCCLLAAVMAARIACKSDLVQWTVCGRLTEEGVKLGPLIRIW